MGRIRLKSSDDTVALGKKMASLLSPRATLALYGDLGAGKTTFVQGLALGLGIEEPIQSPTFVLLNIYNDILYHFDLYRIKDFSEFQSLGFDEMFQKGICVIEWPERIADFLPKDTISIHFEYENEERIAIVSP